MTRLIDADAVYKEICRIYEYEYPTASGAFDEFVSKTLENIIYNAPTVDAEPVRHGHWDDECRCTACGWYGDDWYKRDAVRFSYCPNCGAKMDLEGDNG